MTNSIVEIGARRLGRIANASTAGDIDITARRNNMLIATGRERSMRSIVVGMCTVCDVELHQ